MKKIKKVNYRLYMKYLLSLLLLFSCQDSKHDQSHNDNIDNIKMYSFTKLDSLIQIFDIKDVEVETDGKIMDAITFGSGTGDNEDNIYLIGRNQEIYKIDSSGNLQKRLLRVGNGPGEYARIGHIITDDEKKLYVDDYKHGRILVFDSTFNYINYFPKQTLSPSAFSSIRIFGKNILVGLSVLYTEYGLYKYNTKTFELVKECCSPDKRAMEFNSFIAMGDIDIEGDRLYFTKPHYYQIFNDNNCDESEIINFTSKNFVEINSKVETVFKRKYDYSVLHKFYAEKDFFILKYFGKGEGHDNYDILDKKGNIVKENIPLNFNNNNVLIKYSSGKYFTFSHKQKPNGEIKLIIHYLKLKKEYL